MKDFNENVKIGVVGLGYVGLPLACLFATRYRVVGFDVNKCRVAQVAAGVDHNDDLDPAKLRRALDRGILFTSDLEDLRDCNVYVVAVPTPIDDRHHPDLRILISASETVGKVISRGDTVIFESTVHPGTTEEVCAPAIERVSGLRLNEDFLLGYSPERINPGDTVHTVENIRKITSGSTQEAARFIDRLYSSVLVNGTFPAPSIKVAEAAKILENTQRDVNIAFMNEMSIVCDALGINIYDVIEAASTKWNFLPFKPGLVGGHCISVDPYYLIEKADESGAYPRMTAEARRVNESMGRYIAHRLIRAMDNNGIIVRDARVLVLGVSFKENCRDIRNTKVTDIYHTLRNFTPFVEAFDPNVDRFAFKKEYGIDLISEDDIKWGDYDAVVYCVTHDNFSDLNLDALTREGGVIYDVKGALRKESQIIVNDHQLINTRVC